MRHKNLMSNASYEFKTRFKERSLLSISDPSSSKEKDVQKDKKKQKIALQAS